MYFIDLETTSSEKDIKASGHYRYAEGSSILLFGYAHNLDPVTVVDIANGKTIPADIINILSRAGEIKVAHNAGFERAVLSSVLKTRMPPEQWQCTAAWAAYAGLPRGLDKAAKEVGIAGKMELGAKLIRKFCIDKKEPSGEDWETFKKYNQQDIETERALFYWLQQHYPIPANEWKIWQMDQAINDRGFLIDQDLVSSAMFLLEEHRNLLMTEAKKITGLDNPNSVAQLKKWLDYDGSLNKKTVTEKLLYAEGDQKRALEIRQILGQSAVKKYASLDGMVCKDGRVRGTMLYYGAHTGRWSGRGFQPQNLPRIKPVDPVFARGLIKARDLDSINIFYGDVTSCLATLIRTVIIAPPGGYLWIDDYSAIEARICAWLAGEQWILDVFRTGQPYYEATAAKMYHIPITQVTKALRQKGKVAALLLQYQGSIGALTKADTPMSEQEMLELVQQWRSSCPAIVQYWEKLEEAALTCVRTKKDYQIGIITFKYDGHDMYILLPVGRSLIFRNAGICESAHTGNPSIDYDCEEKGHIVRKQLYGGLLTENIVQGIARDLLADHLLRCKDCCVLHVHDEVVLENTVVDMIMPAWAKDLPMDIKGFKNNFYTKD